MSGIDRVEYYRTIKNGYMAPHRAQYHKRRFDTFCSLLPQRQGMSIFDFGCGSGELAELLTGDGHVVEGSDLSPEMVELARGKMPQCSFAVGGVYDMPASGSWDVVGALNVLPYLSEPEEAAFFRNAVGMLKPHGAIIFSHTNMLTDLVTFNRYTVEFWRDQIIPHVTDDAAQRAELLAAFTNHLAAPDMPPRSAARKSERDLLAKRRINPITYGASLEQYGLRVEDVAFTHYYPMPPQWMEANHPDLIIAFEDRFKRSDLSWVFASILVMRAVRS